MPFYTRLSFQKAEPMQSRRVSAITVSELLCRSERGLVSSERCINNGQSEKLCTWIAPIYELHNL
jgi:hypothetical protein